MVEIIEVVANITDEIDPVRITNMKGRNNNKNTNGLVVRQVSVTYSLNEQIHNLLSVTIHRRVINEISVIIIVIHREGGQIHGIVLVVTGTTTTSRETIGMNSEASIESSDSTICTIQETKVTIEIRPIKLLRHLAIKAITVRIRNTTGVAPPANIIANIEQQT